MQAYYFHLYFVVVGETSRVRKLRITPDPLKPESILLTWQHPEKTLKLSDIIGYNIQYMRWESFPLFDKAILFITTFHLNLCSGKFPSLLRMSLKET